MRPFIKRFFQRSSTELRHSLQFLNPSSGVCPFCGKGLKQTNSSSFIPHTESRKAYLSYLPSGFSKSICSSCLALIPWLTPIKCRTCGRGITCPDCGRRTDASFKANRSAVQYSGEMREWLAQYKYRGNQRLEHLLAQMMFPAFAAITKEAYSRTASPLPCPQPQSGTAMLPSIWDAITYVPVSSERAEERGFNQAERFADILARQYHISVYDLLYRERHTEKQSFKSRSERIKDTRRLFQAKPERMALLQAAMNCPREAGGTVLHSPSRPIRLLLIDDIYTTGSTIQACATALRQQAAIPLEIYALTWARS